MLRQIIADISFDSDGHLSDPSEVIFDHAQEVFEFRGRFYFFNGFPDGAGAEVERFSHLVADLHDLFAGEAGIVEDAVGLLEQIPVIGIEPAFFFSFVVEAGAGPGGGAVVLRVIKVEFTGEGGGFFQSRFGFSGEAEDEVAGNLEAGFAGDFDGFADLVDGDAFFSAVEDALVSGFDAVGDHPAAGFFHFGQQFFIDIIDAAVADPFYFEAPLEDFIAEAVNVLFGDGETFRPEEEIVDAEFFLRPFDFVADTFGGAFADFFTVITLRDAEGAVVGAAAGGHDHGEAAAVEGEGVIVQVDQFPGGEG